MQDLRVSLVQAKLKWEDATHNLANLEQLMEGVVADSDIIVLPEMFNTAFSMKPEIFAEAAGGDTFTWMQKQARKHGAALTGSIMVRQQGDYYNRMYFVLPDGSFEYYDKRHLFRMGNEQEHFSAGNTPKIFTYKGWKIQLLICYDLRFPVWAKNRYDAGDYAYDLSILVANWPAVRAHVWKTLNSARAIENQAYWVGVNRIGVDGFGLDHSGNSNVWDAKGSPMIEQEPYKEFVASVSLSANELKDFRNKFTVGLDWDDFEVKL
jgi:predicted amidohydrolase